VNSDIDRVSVVLDAVKLTIGPIAPRVTKPDAAIAAPASSAPIDHHE